MEIKSLVHPHDETKFVNDFDTWLLYHAVRLHYNTDYSVEKYNFSAKKIYNWNRYLQASDWEVNLFHNWAKTYSIDKNVKMALGAFFFYHKPVGEWQSAPNSEAVTESYQKLKQFLYSPKYFLDIDLTYLKENYTINVLKVTNGNIPRIFQLAHKGEISYESLILIDNAISLTKYVSTKLNTLTWKAYKDNYLKYRPFVCTEMDSEFTEYIKQHLLSLKTTQNI